MQKLHHIKSIGYKEFFLKIDFFYSVVRHNRHEH